MVLGKATQVCAQAAESNSPPAKEGCPKGGVVAFSSRWLRRNKKTPSPFGYSPLAGGEFDLC